MARHPRHLAAVPKTFDATDLSTGELAVYNIARDLAASPAASKPDGAISRIQEAVNQGRHRTAIDVLEEHLAANGLTTDRRQKANNMRFAELRRLRNVSQSQLAEALGIRSSSVSQFESGKGGLELPRLLLAADMLDVAPEQFFRDLQGSAVRRRVP